MAKKAIIFDFDDTLVESWPHKWAQHQAVAQRFYNIDLDESTLRKHWGKPSKELVQHFYENRQSTEQMLKNFHSLDKAYPKTLISTTTKTLGQLSSSGYVLGIVSNARKESLQHDIDSLRLRRTCFDFIHAYEDTHAYKPDPRAFNRAKIELRTRDIEHVIYVGDSLIDLEASRSAGIPFIGVTSGLTSKQEFLQAGAVRVIQKLDELLKLA